jgi:ABC-type lipoprotein export system ATPase subunit
MKKEEFTKTSIHNHFGGNGADKTIDTAYNYSTSFDIKYAKQQIDNASDNDYELLGMTNSNVLITDFYRELREYSLQKGINLIPGAEVNLVDDIGLSFNDRKYLHVVVLINPNNDIDAFSNKLNSLTTNNQTNAITIENLVELIMPFQTILIPHGQKQSPKRDSEHNIEQFQNLCGLRYSIPIIIEDNKKSNTEYLKAKLKDELGEDAYLWLKKEVSSISSRDRISLSTSSLKDFSNISSPTYIWGNNSYESLFYAAIMADKRIYREEDISEKATYIKKIVIENRGGALNSCELTLSHGLNSIIGQSGSGKTLLLNLIKKLTTGGNLVSPISATKPNYDSMYKDCICKIYDNNDNEINKNEINIFEGENLYTQIISALSSDKNHLLTLFEVTPNTSAVSEEIARFNNDINRYVKDKKQINIDNYNVNQSINTLTSSIDFLSKNKVTDSIISYEIDYRDKSKVAEMSSTLNEIKNDLEKVDRLFSSLSEIGKKYSIENYQEHIVKLISLYNKTMKIKYYEVAKSLYEINVKYDKQSKLLEIISFYNNSISKRSSSIAESKRKIKETSESIINNLKDNIIKSNFIIPPVFYKDKMIRGIKVNKESSVSLANINLVDTYSMDDIGTVFSSTIGISTSGKIKKSNFKDIFDQFGGTISLSNNEQLLSFLSVYVLNDFSTELSFTPNMKDFITFDVMIVDNQGIEKDITTLSAGQLSDIYINRLIDSKLSEYKNNAIVLYDQPDNNLGKHFVLETLGDKFTELKRNYQIIITTHEPLLVVNTDSNAIIRVENNKTAGGKERISFENVSFITETDKEKIVDKIADLIDGSHNAIKKRNQVYGGMKQ